MDEGLSPEAREAIGRVASSMRTCQSVLFVTGAGISADSGLPTYRGVGGLYEEAHPEEGIPIEEILSGAMLRLRPELTWKYLLRMERAVRGARPNRAHEVIAEMERRFNRVWTFTQNVDGFHRLAGSRHVIEIHGDMRDLVCVNCGFRQTVENYEGLSETPRCPVCGGLVRPDVILFGEMLAMEKIELLWEQLDLGFDVVVAIGTSAMFHYIVEPVIRARRMGSITVEINPARTELTPEVMVRVPARASLALDELWRRLVGT